MKKAAAITGTICAVILIYILGSIWASCHLLKVNEFTVDTGREETPFRAVVISDLHDHEFGAANHRLAEKIREIQPDLILMDGDMLNDTSGSAKVPLKLIRQLEEAGAVVLDKNFVDIEVNGRGIRLGGMYDYAFGLNGNNDALAAPDDTLTFLQEFQDTDRLKIMMAHRPDSFIFGDASKVWDVDLVISGHNHGGQVVIPFLGGLYGGDQGWFPEYIHGIYEKDNIQMFVTSGLGTHKEKLPRFNNLPEIAVLTIR